MNAVSTLHSAALELNAKGWAIFPCQPRGKTPATARGCLDAVANDPARINTWWGIFPDLNIGVATVAVSGFFVLDIDGDNGEASKLEQERGKNRARAASLIRAHTSLPRSSGVKKYFGPDSPGVIH